jgi:polysaccharide biosynthesis/export protein
MTRFAGQWSIRSFDKGAPRHARRFGCSVAAWIAVGAGAGCSSFISSSGPKLIDVTMSSQIRVQNVPAPTQGFALVRLDAPTASQLGDPEPPPRFGADDVDQPSTAITVGTGDVLQVTIFETGSGGLFVPADAGARPGNYVVLPGQQVGQDGAITVPWAGRIRAAGRTPIAIQNDIAGRLVQRALEPQVVVSMVERHANQVSVLGDVNTANRFSMDPSGERILGAIARAGGPKFPAYETLVTLQRHGRADTALLSEIASNPQQNLAMQGGDTVYVAHEPRYFLALGATGQSTSLSQLDRRFPFGDYEIHLSDALALAGGLQDDRANAQALLLYRYETPDTLKRFGLQVPPSLPDKIPTIYLVDLTDPTGFFLCSQVTMRNSDTIYVANAPITDIQKVLNLFLPFAQSADYVRVTTN